MTKFSESLFDIEEFPNIVGEFYQALILITTICQPLFAVVNKIFYKIFWSNQTGIFIATSESTYS